MRNRLLVAVVFAATSYLTLMSLAGENRFSGRLLFTIGGDHGVHIGDALPLTAWLVVTACCALQWRAAD